MNKWVLKMDEIVSTVNKLVTFDSSGMKEITIEQLEKLEIISKSSLFKVFENGNDVTWMVQHMINAKSGNTDPVLDQCIKAYDFDALKEILTVFKYKGSIVVKMLIVQ